MVEIKVYPGLPWALDVLYGRRPIPTYPSKETHEENFKDYLDKAMEVEHAKLNKEVK